MPRKNDRAPYVSVLCVAATAIVALAACSCGSSTSSSAPSSSVTTTTQPGSTVTSTTPPPAPTVAVAGQFTNLPDRSKVAYQQMVKGTVRNLPPHTCAWIVVYPDSAPAYWPQMPLQLDTEGGFRTSVYFGPSATQASGGTFIVYLVVAPQAACDRFRAFPGPPNPTQGMPAMPDGVQTLATVTVTRD